eukprot:g16616.t1
MIEYKTIKGEREKARGKGANGWKLVHFADGNGRKTRSCGRGGGGRGGGGHGKHDRGGADNGGEFQGKFAEPLPLADDEEGGEGESKADAPRQGRGEEADSESESDLDVVEDRGHADGDEGSVPLSPSSTRGDFGGGEGSPTNSSSSSNSGGGEDSNHCNNSICDALDKDDGSDGNSNSESSRSTSSDVDSAGPGEPGEQSGNSSDSDEREDELAEFKFDSDDDRYPSGTHGEKLIYTASKTGPLCFSLTAGRTQSPIRQLQTIEEEPDDGGAQDSEEALLSTVLETENGQEVVANHLCDSLVKNSYEEEQRMWDAIMRIMAYLNGTKDLGITYVRGSGLDLDVFADASYADNQVEAFNNRTSRDRRRQGGMHSNEDAVRSGPINTEAEYNAAGEGVKEALFVRGVLSFIAPETNGAKTTVREDNEGALRLIENPFSSARTEHIDVRFHFIRELFKSGKITAKFVPTNEQHVDMLTKVLSQGKLEYHRKALM